MVSTSNNVMGTQWLCYSALQQSTSEHSLAQDQGAAATQYSVMLAEIVLPALCLFNNSPPSPPPPPHSTVPPFSHAHLARLCNIIGVLVINRTTVVSHMRSARHTTLCTTRVPTITSPSQTLRCGICLPLMHMLCCPIGGKRALPAACCSPWPILPTLMYSGSSAASAVLPPPAPTMLVAAWPKPLNQPTASSSRFLGPPAAPLAAATLAWRHCSTKQAKV